VNWPLLKIRMLRALWMPTNRLQRWLAKRIISTARQNALVRHLNDQLVRELTK